MNFMKIERREHGITLIYESEFERETLALLKNHPIAKIRFEDNWDNKGNLYIDFNTDWGR